MFIVKKLIKKNLYNKINPNKIHLDIRKFTEKHSKLLFTSLTNFTTNKVYYIKKIYINIRLMKNKKK